MAKKKVVHAREIGRSPPFIPLEASEGDEGEQSGAKRKIGDKLSLMQIKKDFASSRQSHQQHNDYLDSLLRPVNPRAVRIDPWVSPRLALHCFAHIACIFAIRKILTTLPHLHPLRRC